MFWQQVRKLRTVGKTMIFHSLIGEPPKAGPTSGLVQQFIKAILDSHSPLPSVHPQHQLIPRGVSGWLTGSCLVKPQPPANTSRVRLGHMFIATQIAGKGG